MTTSQSIFAILIAQHGIDVFFTILTRVPSTNHLEDDFALVASIRLSVATFLMLCSGYPLVDLQAF